MSMLKRNTGTVSQSAIVQPLDSAGGMVANSPAGLPARENAVTSPGGYGGPVVPRHDYPSISNTVNVNMGMPAIQMNMMTKGHSLVTRLLWFVFVGWWLSAIFIVMGVALTWTVIGMPLGFWFINRIPKAQTLRERTRQFKSEFRGNSIVFTEGHRDQLPWYVRALYTLVLGWAAGLIWLGVAWFFGMLILTLPLSIWMVDRAPAVMTLEKN